MIGLPAYLDPPPGMSIADSDRIAQHVQQVGQMYDPALAAKQKAEAEQAYRAQALNDIARQLEYIRLQLLDMDLRSPADRLDGLVVELIERWVIERRR